MTPRRPRPIVRCACGCGAEVAFRHRKQRTYASPRCATRARSHASFVAMGREGGKARARNVLGRLLDQLAELPRNEAIARAYYLGRRAGYAARYAERARKAAA